MQASSQLEAWTDYVSMPSSPYLLCHVDMAKHEMCMDLECVCQSDFDQ